MTSKEKWQQNLIHREMKRLRMEDKEKENAIKPPLVSSDVVSTGDFVFSPIKPLDRVGDSGPLLLAKRKNNRSEQYLIKHAYCDCACNEFVYTKLVQAMGYKMPDIVLFTVSPDEKRRYFKTEYIMGAKYLNIMNESPSYVEIKSNAKNWKEYFSFRALYAMTGESDSFETPLADDGFIYRVDTTDAFPISNFILSKAGINIEINGVNMKEVCKKQIFNIDFSSAWKMDGFDWWLDRFIDKYGQECMAPFLEPFERIQSISSEYIDDFLNTLCYFYPDYIGDFYKKYIMALQQTSCEYLKTKRV